MTELRKNCNNCRYREFHTIDCIPCQTCHKWDNWELNVERSEESKGLKYDNDKIRVDLVPPEVIIELGKILTYGANKYGPNNWKGLENFNDRYYGAVIRHLMAWRMGEEKDPESGEYHLSHAMTGLMFLVWKQFKKE